MTALLSGWYLPVREKEKLSLKVFAIERLFVSGWGGMTDKEVFFFPLGIGYRTVCVSEKNCRQ